MSKNGKIACSILLAVIICFSVTLGVSFKRIREIEYQLNGLRNDFDYSMQNIQSNISSIYSNVDEQLKKQASILTGYDIEIGPLDTVNFITPLTFTVTPKNLSDDTVVTVTVNDTAVTLNRSGETFKGVIDTDVFLTDNAKPLISVKSNGAIQNEYLEEDVSNLFERFIPQLSSKMTVTQENFENEKIRITGDFIVDYKPNSAESTTTFTQYFLIAEQNKKGIFRKDITKQVEEADGDMCQLEEIISTSDYSNIDYYILATDSLGLTHKSRVICTYVGGDNTVIQEVEDDAIYTGNWIYDGNGNLLYPKTQ